MKKGTALYDALHSASKTAKHTNVALKKGKKNKVGMSKTVNNMDVQKGANVDLKTTKDQSIKNLTTQPGAVVNVTLLI